MAEIRRLLICTVLLVAVGNGNAATTFDNMVWYHSHDPSKLSVNADGQLEWEPHKPHTVYVRLADHDLSQIGSSVSVSYMWHSVGDFLDCDCHDPENCNFDDDVTCLAGTGDFRLGLFDSNAKGYISQDYFGEKNAIFLGYLGYQWRFHPHICDSERFIEVKPDGSTESHTNVTCWKRNQPYIEPCGEELLGDCDPRPWVRIKSPVPACFNLGFDEWALMMIEVERISSTALKTTFSFNGLSFDVTDSSTTYQPQKIDVFAIHMSNARPYDIVVLADTCEALTADFDDSHVVDYNDLGLLAWWWLERCRSDLCEGTDLNESRIVDLRDLAIFALQWQQQCQ